MAHISTNDETEEMLFNTNFILVCLTLLYTSEVGTGLEF